MDPNLAQQEDYPLWDSKEGMREPSRHPFVARTSRIVSKSLAWICYGTVVHPHTHGVDWNHGCQQPVPLIHMKCPLVSISFWCISSILSCLCSALSINVPDWYACCFLWIWWSTSISNIFKGNEEIPVILLVWVWCTTTFWNKHYSADFLGLRPIA